MYGILRSITNTGLDSELIATFAAPLNIVSNQPAFISDTLSLKRRVGSQVAQRWEIDAAIAPTNDTAELMVNMVIAGYTDVIFVRMPQPVRSAASRMPVARDVRLNGTHLVGDNVINIKGSLGFKMPIGEFITIAGETKVYLVIGSSNDGASMEIRPALRQNLPDNAKIAFGDAVTMRARYDTSVQLGIRYRDGILVDMGTVKFVEAV
jgi:hypothetical protein